MPAPRKDTVKILVTAGGSLLSQGIIRAARQSDMPLRIAVCDPEPLSAGLYWADEAYSIGYCARCEYPEDLRRPEYINRLREIIRESRPDVVIPGTDHELPILAAYREELEADCGCKVLVSRLHQVWVADDKWATYLWLRKEGLPRPDSAIWSDAEALAARVGFPLVCKPRIGWRSIDNRLILNMDDLRAIIDDEDIRLRYIFQECVGTMEQEYTAGTLHFDGQVASIVLRRVLRDGNTYQAFAEPYPALNEWVRQVARQFGAYGPANFQFRLDAQGIPKIFEINARFSGTTGIRWHAGFNDLDLALRYLLFGAPMRQPDVKSCVILRHWSETVIAPESVKW